MNTQIENKVYNLSDSDEEVKEEENEVEDTRSDDEMAEYLKEIVLNNSNKGQLNLESITKKDKIVSKGKVSKEKKDKSKNSLSLVDFNNKIDEVIQKNKPKKFVSKRVEEKKEKIEVVETVYKRSFEPRLPPFNFVNKNHNNHTKININDTDLFPCL
jgi:hypothetical protein